MYHTGTHIQCTKLTSTYVYNYILIYIDKKHKEQQIDYIYRINLFNSI